MIVMDILLSLAIHLQCEPVSHVNKYKNRVLSEEFHHYSYCKSRRQHNTTTQTRPSKPSRRGQNKQKMDANT